MGVEKPVPAERDRLAWRYVSISAEVSPLTLPFWKRGAEDEKRKPPDPVWTGQKQSAGPTRMRCHAGSGAGTAPILGD